VTHTVCVGLNIAHSWNKPRVWLKMQSWIS